MKPKTNYSNSPLQRIMRLISYHDTTTLIIMIVIVVSMILGSYFIWSDTSQWINKINDPTERGLAYVSAAIVFHAIFGKN